MRNACFCISRPSILASKTNPKKYVFSKCFPRYPFGCFYVAFMRKLSIWGPLQNPVGAKMGFKTDQVVPKVQKIQSLGHARASLDPTGAQTAAQSTPRLYLGRFCYYTGSPCVFVAPPFGSISPSVESLLDRCLHPRHRHHHHHHRRSDPKRSHTRTDRVG